MENFLKGRDEPTSVSLRTLDVDLSSKNTQIARRAAPSVDRPRYGICQDGRSWDQCLSDAVLNSAYKVGCRIVTGFLGPLFWIMLGVQLGKLGLNDGIILPNPQNPNRQPAFPTMWICGLARGVIG